MDVASRDEELPEDFLSDKELTSAPEIAPTEPDDSEVLKDPQVTCQIRSASTHAETPAAEAPQPARVLPTTKVDQNPSIARPSTARPFDPQLSTPQQSSTSQPTTSPPTDSPSQTDVPSEPMSHAQATKRPLEQIPQPESKRMSLGEHGILAAEDLRWLPRQRPRGVRGPPTCWNPDKADGRGQVLTPFAQDEVVEVAFALSHHEAVKIAETPATALAALARQERGEVLSTLTPREREDLVKAKQKEISSFLKHAAVEAATRSGSQCNSLMRMRWVITRKPDNPLKARLVVQGFTDPQLGAKPTASPTVSRRGRQLFLTVAGSLRMRVFRGDAKTAFS